MWRHSEGLGGHMWRHSEEGIRGHMWRHSEEGIRGSHVEAFGGRG